MQSSPIDFFLTTCPKGNLINNLWGGTTHIIFYYFSEMLVETHMVIFDFQGKLSLYSSWMEFQGLLKQVLSRDIRSLSQRQKPHNAILSALNEQYLNAPKDVSFDALQKAIDNAESFDETNLVTDTDQSAPVADKIEYAEASTYDVEYEKIERDDKVVYHLVLEGVDVSYTLLEDGRVLVEGASLTKALKPAASRDFDPRNWRHLFTNNA